MRSRDAGPPGARGLVTQFAYQARARAISTARVRIICASAFRLDVPVALPDVSALQQLAVCCQETVRVPVLQALAELAK
jgi:hypothetical protein